jgi:hypothetical protein
LKKTLEKLRPGVFPLPAFSRKRSFEENFLFCAKIAEPSFNELAGSLRLWPAAE